MSRIIAITRPVSSTINQCELTHLVRDTIDVELAQSQHRTYEVTLAALGCDVRPLVGVGQVLVVAWKELGYSRKVLGLTCHEQQFALGPVDLLGQRRETRVSRLVESRVRRQERDEDGDCRYYVEPNPKSHCDLPRFRSSRRPS